MDTPSIRLSRAAGASRLPPHSGHGRCSVTSASAALTAGPGFASRSTSSRRIRGTIDWYCALAGNRGNGFGGFWAGPCKRNCTRSSGHSRNGRSLSKNPE